MTTPPPARPPAPRVLTHILTNPHPPGALSHLRDLKIRGGYYYGYEVTNLVSVQVVKSLDDGLFPCCSASGIVSTCTLKPSPLLMDPHTRFPCEGERH